MPKYQINYTTMLDCYAYVEADSITDALALFLDGEYDDVEVMNQEPDLDNVLISKMED